MRRLIDADELKNIILDYKPDDLNEIDINFITCDIKLSLPIILKLIDNAPTVKPCDNCDLYVKAMTKEEMKKGGAE